MNYSTTFKTICLRIIQEGKPLSRFWIKSTLDCQGLFKRFQEEVEELRKEHPNNLNSYIREVKGCNQKSANKTQNALNCCYAEKATLTPLKAIQMEGMLSRELFSEIVDFVFNNYEWSERLDGEIDRIILKYRTKGKLGRNKITVRKALYKAYALGV